MSESDHPETSPPRRCCATYFDALWFCYSLIKRAENSESDTAEQSAIKVPAQQQASNALVAVDQRQTNGDVPASQLGMVKIPSMSNAPIESIAERFHALCRKDSGVLYEDPYIQIGIKGEWRAHHGRLVLFLGNKTTSPLVSVRTVILAPVHLKMELSMVPETIPPRAQVQCPLEVVNLRPSRDVAVLDFTYKFTNVVNVKLRLPAVLNKCFKPISLSAEDFFTMWRSSSGPPLKLQEVVRGVRPMSLSEMAILLNSFSLTICPELDPNPNNLVASTLFNSESTGGSICLVRIETDPADRTQLRVTVSSGDVALTYELMEFIKEQLVFPGGVPPPAAAAPPLQPQIQVMSLSDQNISL